MTKKLEVIIREEKLAAVKDALRNIGIVGMNIVEVRGHGRDGGITLTGRSGTYQVDMLPRVQLNIVLSDRNVDKTVETIKQATSNGSHGEGIIFIYPVEDVIRIPSGEHGSEALMYESDIDARRMAEVAELAA
jgi:nitrogen regulatory protein P-II 1